MSEEIEAVEFLPDSPTTGQRVKLTSTGQVLEFNGVEWDEVEQEAEADGVEKTEVEGDTLTGDEGVVHCRARAYAREDRIQLACQLADGSVEKKPLDVPALGDKTDDQLREIISEHVGVDVKAINLTWN